MPELPEVETIVTDLRPRLVGRRIASFRVGKKNLRRPWNTRWTSALRGKKIETVVRRGKWIVLRLEKGLHLVFHLGMTGQLMVVQARQPLASHTHVVADLDETDEQLHFRDIRRFGSVTFFAGEAHVNRFFHDSGLGPEPFDLEPGYWRTFMRMRRCLRPSFIQDVWAARSGPRRLAGFDAPSSKS